jgi:predicted anti-sigma-YlaC factor YlaD
MNCKQINNRLIFFIEKSLPVAEMQQVEIHLEKCESCRELAGMMEKTMAVIEDEKSVTTNPFLHTRVMQKIEERKKDRLHTPISSLKSHLQPVFYSAVIAIGVVFGIGLGNLTVNSSESVLAENGVEEIYFNDFQQEYIETMFLNDNQ